MEKEYVPTIVPDADPCICRNFSYNILELSFLPTWDNKIPIKRLPRFEYNFWINQLKCKKSSEHICIESKINIENRRKSGKRYMQIFEHSVESILCWENVQNNPTIKSYGIGQHQIEWISTWILLSFHHTSDSILCILAIFM